MCLTNMSGDAYLEIVKMAVETSQHTAALIGSHLSTRHRERLVSCGHGLRPCPRDTFPHPVARVHTGATGTLVPDPRDHPSTWNERARSIAIGCTLSNMSCGRSSGRYRPVSKSAAVGTRLLDLDTYTCALSHVFNRLLTLKPMRER